MSVASEIARLQNAKASIKTAIENKGVTVGDIKLDAYSAKIDEISTGVEPTGTLEITQNGTYDVKQKAYAKVAVPEPSGNIKITENGFHIIKEYSIAEVAVYPTLIAKTILTNGTYNASDDNAYGYGSVSVNVPEKKLGTKTINANGDYNATDDSLDGYSNVSVSVPEKTLTTKTITANGTYNATDDNADGYSQVTVETSGVDINDYFYNTISEGSQYGAGVTKMIKRVISPVTIDGYYADYAFSLAFNLVEAPQINMGKARSMVSMFQQCYKLETIPQMDTSNITNMNGCFYMCNKLTTLPISDTSKVTDMGIAFGYCYALTQIPKLSCVSVEVIKNLVAGDANLKDIGGFTNLGQAYKTTQSANYSNYTLTLSECPNLTHDSLMNVINDLYDIASKGVATQQLIIGSVNLKKLTAEEIQIATEKGFSVS